MNTIAVAALLGVAAAAAGGFFVVEELRSECRGDPIAGVPPGPGAEQIRLTIGNDQLDEPIRTCMFASDGSKLFDQTLDAYGTKAQYWDLHLAGPVDVWLIDRPWPEDVDMDRLVPFTSEKQCGKQVAEFL